MKNILLLATKGPHSIEHHAPSGSCQPPWSPSFSSFPTSSPAARPSPWRGLWKAPHVASLCFISWPLPITSHPCLLAALLVSLFLLWGHSVARGWWLSRQVVSDSFVTPRSVAHQTLLSMGFPRQEYWSGLPFPPPGDLLHPGIRPASSALAGGLFTIEPPGTPWKRANHTMFFCCSNCSSDMYVEIHSGLSVPLEDFSTRATQGLILSWTLEPPPDSGLLLCCPHLKCYFPGSSSYSFFGSQLKIHLLHEAFFDSLICRGLHLRLDCAAHHTHLILLIVLPN